MRVLRSVSPFVCRMWNLHDRLDESVDEESCQNEIESIARHGQLVPVLARPLIEDPSHKFELIFGARRLFACRHINRPIEIEVRQMTDREAIIAMDIENRQRKDLSPYERGMSYARFLRGGHFTSQDDIARSLDVSASQVSRLLKLAALPSVVISAFGSAREICETWGLDLADALNDPKRRQVTVSRARNIAAAAARVPPVEVYRQLISAPSSSRRNRPVGARDEVVSGEGGAPLFRIRHQRHDVAILLPIKSVPAHILSEIRAAVADILDRATAGNTTIVQNATTAVGYGMLERSGVAAGVPELPSC
jgi:ParB family transcriptional regulator, chromosome partitioning protein